MSALTDFKEYTMIAPKRLAKYVGLTETEVKDMCEKQGMSFEKMKAWYDGYSFNRIKSVFIPNEEVRQEFIRTVKAGKHKEVAKMILYNNRGF